MECAGKRSVLDLGCGRGRWSREYAKRGFEVTGVDLSPQAIGLLADEMRQHQFVCGDVAEQEFSDQSFDVINSVTVLQHLPEPKQRGVMDHLSRWVKRGGFVVLLENVRAFDAPHVFPHLPEEWVQMVEATGLKCVYQRGSNFEPLLRVARHARHIFHKGPREKMFAPVPSYAPPDFKSRIKSVATGTLAVASFPVELIAHHVPIASPTHSVMIFTKSA
jgi:SAM-dependent methyltransferase